MRVVQLIHAFLSGCLVGVLYIHILHKSGPEVVTITVVTVVSQFILVFCLFFLGFLFDFAHHALDKMCFWAKIQKN